MRLRALALILVPAALFAQTREDRLHATLLHLSEPNVSQPFLLAELVENMQAIATRDREPSLGALRNFADPLVRALAGRKLPVESLNAIEKCLRDVLRPSGSTMGPASRLREELNHVVQDAADTDRIVKRFVKVGEEVRGPDDTPVLPRFNNPLK